MRTDRTATTDLSFASIMDHNLWTNNMEYNLCLEQYGDSDVGDLKSDNFLCWLQNFDLGDIF